MMIIEKSWSNAIIYVAILFFLVTNSCSTIKQEGLNWPVKHISEIQGSFLTRDGILVNGVIHRIPKKAVYGQINLPFSWFFIDGKQGIQGYYDSNRPGNEPHSLTLYNYKEGVIIKSIWSTDSADYFNTYRDKFISSDYQRITQYSVNLEFEKVLFDLGENWFRDRKSLGPFLQVNENEIVLLLTDRENQPPFARLVSINLSTSEITTIMEKVQYRSLFVENEEKVYFMKNNTIQYYSLSTKEITEEYTFEEGGIFSYKKDSEGNYYIQFTRGERGPFSTLPTPYWCMITPTGEKYLIDGLPFYDSNDPLYFEGIR